MCLHAAVVRCGQFFHLAPFSGVLHQTRPGSSLARTCHCNHFGHLKQVASNLINPYPFHYRRVTTEPHVKHYIAFFSMGWCPSTSRVSVNRDTRGLENAGIADPRPLFHGEVKIHHKWLQCAANGWLQMMENTWRSPATTKLLFSICFFFSSFFVKKEWHRTHWQTVLSAVRWIATNNKQCSTRIKWNPLLSTSCRLKKHATTAQHQTSKCTTACQ